MTAGLAGGNIPRGIEVLVKKASVDPAFREALIENRSKSAALIGLTLDPAEAAIIDIIPRAQLEAIIERTTVHPSLRPAFLGYAAAVMLVALGAAGCSDVWNPHSAGTTPAPPPAVHEIQSADNATSSSAIKPAPADNAPKMLPGYGSGGSRADVPPALAGKGLSPDRVGDSLSAGIRAQLPPKPEPAPPTPEEKRQRAKEAETAIERFQQDHPRVAEYIRISDRIRLYRDNPSAPQAQDKLAAEERNLKALGNVSEDDVAAYKEQWARLLDAMRKAKAEAAK